MTGLRLVLAQLNMTVGDIMGDEIIDPIMEAYIEENLMAEEIAERGFKHADVERIIRLIDQRT